MHGKQSNLNLTAEIRGLNAHFAPGLVVLQAELLVDPKKTRFQTGLFDSSGGPAHSVM
jgi:hypothetical protein